MNLKNLLLLFALGLFFFTGCDDEDMEEEKLPSVSTNQVEEIKGESAVCGGIIDDDAGSTVVERGVCWDTIPNPTIENDTTLDGSGGGSFTSIMEDLNSGTEYYVRAYATNEYGTGYGMTYSFSTLSYPKIDTTEITEVKGESAVIEGVISDKNGSEIEEMGVCWSQEEEPTIEDNTKGVYTHSFEETINRLNPGTKYYVRVYVISDAGTHYGNTISFTTLLEEHLEEEEEDEQSESIPKISVTEVAPGDSANTTVYVSDLETGSTEVEVEVKFASEDDKMRRLYMTENIAGAGADKYELDIEDLSKKGDGSIDLSSNAAYGFTFSIPLPLLSDMSEGTVTYKLWTTSGRGDYRDHKKRLVSGPGTITINYGGENPDDVAVDEYTAKILAAPLSDGSSETFISLLDGELYRVDQGEEFAAFWDFGYYYANTQEASLASSYDYPSSIIDVPEVSNTPVDELNHTYFVQSDWTVEDFDAIEDASDLDVIEQSNSETITNLEVGDVIEFVDSYGKKGLIKVTEIKSGWNPDDYIELDIKVQP